MQDRLCYIAHCKCRKAGGPGCKCLSCSNLPSTANLDLLSVEVEETNNGVSDSDDDLEEEVNNITHDVFGHDDDVDSHDMNVTSDSASDSDRVHVNVFLFCGLYSMFSHISLMITLTTQFKQKHAME